MTIHGKVIDPNIIKLIFSCYRHNVQLNNNSGKLHYSGSKSDVNRVIQRLAESKEEILALLTPFEDKILILVQANDFDEVDLADVYLMWRLSPNDAEYIVNCRMASLQLT